MWIFITFMTDFIYVSGCISKNIFAHRLVTLALCFRRAIKGRMCETFAQHLNFYNPAR